jgi:D-alanyl-D-alanine carboxypeptidase
MQFLSNGKRMKFLPACPWRCGRWLPAAMLLATACAPPTGTTMAAAPSHTQERNGRDSLDAWVTSLMAERRIPGLALAVVRNGSIVRTGYYGLANVELNVPVTGETAFKIASMSKAFTAAALMLLVEDGVVGLDDRVTRHLDGLPAAWNSITLRQLMNNTSGLSNDWDLNPSLDTPPEAWTVNSSDYFLRNTTDDDFLRALAELPLLFPPGERYNYAAGTFVIGKVIEKVAGVPYAEFMRTRIFEPLGMNRTMINDASRVVPHRAAGYRLQNGSLMNGYVISPAAEARGDVGVLTTAVDLVRWDAAMRDTVLLSRTSLEIIAAPARLNDGSSYPYGFGWNLWWIRGFRTMSHGGVFRTGFASVMDRFVGADLTVIVVANLWGAFSGREIGQEIASFIHPGFRRLSSMSPRPDPDTARTRMLRSVIGLVGSRPHDPARMTAGFPIGAYTAARWKERHETMRSFSFVDCESRRSQAGGSDDSPVSEVCFYDFADERGRGFLLFALAGDGRVADLYTEEFTPHP